MHKFPKDFFLFHKGIIFCFHNKIIEQKRKKGKKVKKFWKIDFEVLNSGKSEEIDVLLFDVDGHLEGRIKECLVGLTGMSVIEK